MFAVRRAMTFRFDLCIIAMKKVRLYAVLNAVNVISLSKCRVRCAVIFYLDIMFARRRVMTFTID